jgi:hypothetical protein
MWSTGVLSLIIVSFASWPTLLTDGLVSAVHGPLIQLVKPLEDRLGQAEAPCIRIELVLTDDVDLGKERYQLCMGLLGINKATPVSL